MQTNAFPTQELQEQLTKVKQMTAKEMRETFPLYPTLKQDSFGDGVMFSTLVRKRHEGRYYLYPMYTMAINEAQAIHALHKSVYLFLMIGVCSVLDKEDNNQEDEWVRVRGL